METSSAVSQSVSSDTSGKLPGRISVQRSDGISFLSQELSEVIDPDVAELLAADGISVEQFMNDMDWYPMTWSPRPQAAIREDLKTLGDCPEKRSAKLHLRSPVSLMFEGYCPAGLLELKGDLKTLLGTLSSKRSSIENQVMCLVRKGQDDSKLRSAMRRAAARQRRVEAYLKQVKERLREPGLAKTNV